MEIKHKVYILEGPDNAGKTTYINKLISQSVIKPVLWVDEEPETFWTKEKEQKVIDFIDSNIKHRSVLLHRSQISEFIYSRLFKRKSELKDIEFFNFLFDLKHSKKYDYEVIFMTADVKTLMKRTIKEGMIKQLEYIFAQSEKFEDMFTTLKTFGINVKKIDTTNKK